MPDVVCFLRWWLVSHCLGKKAKVMTNEHDVPVVLEDAIIDLTDVEEPPQGDKKAGKSKVIDVLDDDDVEEAIVAGEDQAETQALYPNPSSLFPKVTFTVRSLTENDPGVKFSLRVNESFEQVYYKYAARVDCLPDDITIKKVGAIIVGSETPERAGIHTGAKLFVVGRNDEDNMDVRTKVIYLRKVRTRPMYKKVIIWVDAYLEKLFQIWSEEGDVNRDYITMIHENREVTPIHTV
ncbi:uncharacterized protein LOC110730408 isoform X2 [Chenopodium quinoa]|uniref:uncharacterized protein LOC110730408 isoform X2 n=1 Tax=Chenopodium quinoa TaxID=63459 RepID=UPI000B78C9AA|nr:uncharacterized protein LOC110730408 isoform X2 [Chenopodium quinoa]